MESNPNWIGVDLDGTLAFHDHWRGNMHIGAPIEPMVNRINTWLADGMRVKILTARANDGPEVIANIQNWLERHGLPRLDVVAAKDYNMIELWDDKVVAVRRNTGELK